MQKSDFTRRLKEYIEPLLPTLLENNKLIDDRHIYYFSASSETETYINIVDYKDYERIYSAINFLSSDKQISSSFSSKHLQRRLIATLHKIIADTTQFDTILSEFWNEVGNGSSTEWHAYSQLNSVELDNIEYHLLDSTIKTLVAEDFPRDRPRGMIERDVDLLSKSCIFTNVTAGDVTKAKELAFENFRISLDLIRLYYPYLHLHVKGTELSGISDYLIWSPSKRTYQICTEKMGKMDNPEYFSEEMYNELIQKGINSLKENNEITKKVKIGLRWFGLGIDELLQSAKLINFVTVLESGLKFGSENSELTQRIADRCAFLLGENCESRKKISGDIKKIYGIRSKVIHTGSTDIEPNISELARTYACDVLRKLIEYNNIKKSFHQVIDDIDTKKYS